MAGEFEETGTDTDIYTLTAGKTVDFGALDFSGVKVESADTTGTITVENGSKTFNVTNNNAVSASDPDKGHVDLAGTDMMGGSLLSDLKNLAEDGLTVDKANSFKNTINEALSQLNVNRGDFGSTQNSLSSSVRSMEAGITSVTNAEAIIREVDYASETANFNKLNIQSQAGSYAISQANAMSQNILRLLQ